MEIIVLVLVLGLIAGGMTMMLAAGYVSTEKERERQGLVCRAEAAPKAKPIVFLPPGFFQPSHPPARVAFVFDDGLVHQLETHVRNEQALVEQFVHRPSIDNLYRQPGARLQLH